MHNEPVELLQNKIFAPFGGVVLPGFWLPLYRQKPQDIFNHLFGVDYQKQPFAVVIGRGLVILFLDALGQAVSYGFHFCPFFRAENDEQCQAVLFRNQRAERFALFISEAPAVLPAAEQPFRDKDIRVILIDQLLYILPVLKSLLPHPSLNLRIDGRIITMRHPNAGFVHYSSYALRNPPVHYPVGLERLLGIAVIVLFLQQIHPLFSRTCLFRAVKKHAQY